jgi:hypothetical protein
MALPYAFTNNTSPTGEELDADLAALGALTPIPCTIAGTNTLTLATNTNTPTVSAYANYGLFTGIAAATNTGSATGAVGSLAALNIYKDTIGGPVLLSGGEIVINTKVLLMYDSTLNTGAGGFHLIAPPSVATRVKTTTASITLGAILPQQGSTATVTLGGTSVADVISIGFPASPSIGLNWQGFVPNAGTVVLQVFNLFAAVTVTPSAGSYRVTAQGYS